VAGEYCFRPVHKLLRTDGFSEVFEYRRVLRGKLFDLHFRPNLTGSARLGLVVPKKHLPLSVTRNRYKRVARDIFRLRRSGLPALDVVLRLARKPMVGQELKPALAIREDIESLLGRLPK
jgi:ribonuclease P protein component